MNIFHQVHKKELLISLLFLVVLVVVFFYKQIFYQEVFYCCDNLLINIPAKIFLVEELKHGQLPVINPYLFSGTRFLADINLGIFSMSTLFFIILEPFHALTLTSIFCVGSITIGMYVATRLWGRTHLEAILSSVIFAFSGTVIGYTGNLPMIQVVSVFPWLFAVWILYVSKQSKRNAGFIILFSVFQILSGHPQLTLYSFMFCYLYAFIFLSGNKIANLRRLGLIAIYTLFLSGIQLIPFIEFAVHTTRIGNGFSYAVAGALPLSAIIRLFVPAVTGNINTGTDWWQGGSVYGYTGIISFICLLPAVFSKQKKELFLTSMAVVSGLAAFGASTPVFPMLYYLIPGIGLFRVPSHFFLITTFCIALLAGKGIHILKYSNEKKFEFDARICIFFAIGLVFVGSVLYLQQSHIISIISATQSVSIQKKLLLMGPTGLKTIYVSITQNIVWIGFQILVVSGTFLFRKKFLGIAVIGIVCADLFMFSRMNIISIPYENVSSWKIEQQRVVSDLSSHIQPGYRVYIHPSLYQSPYTRVFGTPWMEQEIHWQYQSMRSDMLMNYRIPVINGYAAMIDKSYQSLFGVKAEDPTGVTIPDTSISQIQQSGAKYILFPANKPIPDLFTSITKPVWKNDQIQLVEFIQSIQVPTKTFSSSTTKYLDIGIIISLVGAILFVVLPLQ